MHWWRHIPLLPLNYPAAVIEDHLDFQMEISVETSSVGGVTNKVKSFYSIMNWIDQEQRPDEHPIRQAILKSESTLSILRNWTWFER